VFVLKIRYKVCRLSMGVVIALARYWIESARVRNLAEGCEEGHSRNRGDTCKVRMQTRSVTREEGEYWMDEVVVAVRSLSILPRSGVTKVLTT